jgi:dTDP-4-dehydrorhamnose reductase
MRILILGGAGMLGHQLWRQLHERHEVWVTLRKSHSHYARYGLFDPAKTISGVDVASPDTLETVFRQSKPEAVINCIGIIKQLPEARNPLISLAINSVLPHRLAQLCAIGGSRLIHISTDCIFNGQQGNRTEADPSNADDLYGRTKFLGEVHEPHCVTLRTSIIGRELETKSGLIEWFLSQSGQTIKGFRKMIFTGLTTMEISRIIERILLQHPGLGGLWQVSSEPISKYELLKLAQAAFRWKGEILPDDEVVCDRSLNSERFRIETGYRPPSWEMMIQELSRTQEK